MAVDHSMPVLVVDDYKTMIRIIRNLLKQLGFDDVDDPSAPTDGTRLYTRDLALATNYAGAGTAEAAAFCLDIMGRADLAKAALHQAEAPGINNTTHNSEDIHG